MARAINFLLFIINNYWRNIWRGNKKSSYILYVILLPFLIYRYLSFTGNLRQSLATEDFTSLGIALLINLSVWVLPVWKSQYIARQVKDHLYFPLRFREIYGINFLSVFLFPTSLFALSVFFTSFYYLPYNSLFLKQLVLISIFNLISIQIFLFSIYLFKRKIIKIILVAALVITASVLALKGLEIKAHFDLINLTSQVFSIFILQTNQSFTSKLVLSFAVLVLCSAFSYLLLKDGLYLQSKPTFFRNLSLFQISKLPFRFGELVKNNLIHFSRFWHVYVGFAVSIYYSILLIEEPKVNYAAINLLIIIVTVINADLVFNYFGYETQSSIERYLISPIRPRTVIITKLISFLLALFLQFLIPVLIILLGISFLEGVIFGLKVMVISVPYMISGTYFSIKFPVSNRYLKMPPDNALLFYALGLFFCSLYVLTGDILNLEYFTAKFLFNGLLFILGALVLYFSLLGFSAYLDKNWEKIKSHIS